MGEHFEQHAGKHAGKQFVEAFAVRGNPEDTPRPKPPAPGRNGRWVKLGDVSVDGAAIGISDPAYVNSHSTMPHPLPLADGRAAPFGSGVQFWAGFGDGGYDVWAWIADYGEGDEVDERIAQVVVTMIDDEDLERWRQPWPIGNSGGPS